MGSVTWLGTAIGRAGCPAPAPGWRGLGRRGGLCALVGWVLPPPLAPTRRAPLLLRHLSSLTGWPTVVRPRACCPATICCAPPRRCASSTVAAAYLARRTLWPPLCWCALGTGGGTRAFLALPGVRAGDFELRPSHPDNFLLLPASAGVRDLLLGARPVVVHGTTLVLHPWTRLAHAARVELFFKVKLEIVGIPPHAWSRDTASMILAPACWIEKVDAASADKTDQSFFGVTAWTNDPSAIPRSVSLLIAENELRVVHSDEVLHRIFDRLPSYLRKKVTLKYGVMVHLREVEDLAPSSSSSSSSPSPPSSDDDSGLGENPGRRFLSSGRGWGSRRWRFPCSRGVPDGGSASGGAGPPANGGVGENAGGAHELSASGELAGQGSKAVALSSDHPVVGASRDGPCFPSGDSWEAVFLESLISHSPSSLSPLESRAALLLDPMLDEAGQRHGTALPACLPEAVDMSDRDASHELSPSLGEPLASSLEPCTGVDTSVLGSTSAAGLVGEAAGVSVDVGVGGGAVSSGARPASETRPAAWVAHRLRSAHCARSSIRSRPRRVRCLARRLWWPRPR